MGAKQKRLADSCLSAFWDGARMADHYPFTMTFAASTADLDSLESRGLHVSSFYEGHEEDP
jgi:hypothetical protein